MLHGGATADMQRLTIGRRDGGTRHLVLRSFVAPTRQGPAEDLLHREADALTALTSTGVSAPGSNDVLFDRRRRSNRRAL
ncbi:hypothetical protein SUDANB150_00011 [Streptomyces sp. enrichment culture]